MERNNMKNSFQKLYIYRCRECDNLIASLHKIKNLKGFCNLEYDIYVDTTFAFVKVVKELDFDIDDQLIETDHFFADFIKLHNRAIQV